MNPLFIYISNYFLILMDNSYHYFYSLKIFNLLQVFISLHAKRRTEEKLNLNPKRLQHSWSWDHQLQLSHRGSTLLK